MHLGDTIFIFCLALIIFGPKKLPEIAKQLGKLMVELRRASNEFKMQIDDELRASEEAERQKEISAPPVQSQASANMAVAAAASVAPPVIAPPSVGTQVSYSAPLSDSVETAPFNEAASEHEYALNTASNSLAVEPEPSTVIPFPAAAEAADAEAEIVHAQLQAERQAYHHG